PTEGCHVSENRVAADAAIVRDVDVRHEYVAVADFGDAPATARAAMNRHEFAEDVPAANDETRLFTAELEILRDLADRGEWKDLRVFADPRPAINVGGRSYLAVRADPHIRTDGRIRSNRGSRPYLSARMNNGGRVDFHVVRHQAKQQLG